MLVLPYGLRSSSYSTILYIPEHRKVMQSSYPIFPEHLTNKLKCLQIYLNSLSESCDLCG